MESVPSALIFLLLPLLSHADSAHFVKVGRL